MHTFTLIIELQHMIVIPAPKMLDSVFTQNAVGKVMFGACMHVPQRELGVELDNVPIQGEGLLLNQKLEVPLL